MPVNNVHGQSFHQLWLPRRVSRILVDSYDGQIGLRETSYFSHRPGHLHLSRKSMYVDGNQGDENKDRCLWVCTHGLLSMRLKGYRLWTINLLLYRISVGIALMGWIFRPRLGRSFTCSSPEPGIYFCSFFALCNPTSYVFSSHLAKQAYSLAHGRSHFRSFRLKDLALSWQP